MNIGLIHSDYRSQIPSGENLTVTDISRILSGIGHNVSEWRASTDSLQYSLISQSQRAHQITRKNHENPKFRDWVYAQDAIQIHNYFPLLTYSDLEVLTRSGKPISRVIHNYRKSCIAGSHFRKEKSCKSCSIESGLNGVLHRCYNGSVLKSFFANTYRNEINSFESQSVTHYIAISDHIKKYLINTGVQPDLIHVIHNSVTPRAEIVKTASQALILGRLEAEKGIFDVAKIWVTDPRLPTLNVVGTGSMFNQIKEMEDSATNLKVHGLKMGDDLDLIASKCKLAIIPSKWEEPFGRVAIEALSRGQFLIMSESAISETVIKSGQNGSLLSSDLTNLGDLVIDGLATDFSCHYSISREIWNQNFSPRRIERVWKHYYENYYQIESGYAQI